MSRECSGGCGHRLHDCCEADIAEPHQSSCRSMAIPFRVDGSRVHLGQVRSTAEVEAGWRRLSCIGGCDLSRVAMYEALTGEQLSDADDASLCPAFYRPMRPLAVIPAVLTN